LLQNKPFNAILNKILPLPQRASAFYFKYASYRSTDFQDLAEATDEEQFLDKLYAYDSMSKLDKWKTAIFLRVKANFDAEPDLT